MTDPRDMLGIALLVVQASLAVPLIWRLARSTKRRGISLTGEMIWIIGGFGWAAYAMLAQSTTVLISSVLAVITSGTLSVLLWRSAERRTPAVAAAAVTLLFLGGSLAFAGLPGLSIGLSVFGVLQFAPQLVMSARQLARREQSLGVSAIGVGVRALYTAGWAMWAALPFLRGDGAAAIDWPILTWGVAGALAFALQCVVVLRSPNKNLLR